MFSRNPQKRNYGVVNRHFKPNLLNIRMTLSSKPLIRSKQNLKSGFRIVEDFVGGPALPKVNSRWRTTSILHVYIRFNGRNSVASGYIGTKFDVGTKTDVLKIVLLLYRPKPIYCNRQVGHYSGFSRISPSILNRFTPNLQA